MDQAQPPKQPKKNGSKGDVKKDSVTPPAKNEVDKPTGKDSVSFTMSQVPPPKSAADATSSGVAPPATGSTQSTDSAGDFTELQESLLILSACKTHLTSALNILNINDPDRAHYLEDEDLKFVACNFLKIQVCSFLEEWGRFERQGGDPEVQDTLRIAKPAIDHIRGWPGLRAIRNKLLAHPNRHRLHRSRREEPMWAWEAFEQFNAPTNYAEDILLGNCAVAAISIALDQHKPEYEEALKKLEKISRDVEHKGVETHEELMREFDRIIKEMADALKEVKEKEKTDGDTDTTT